MSSLTSPDPDRKKPDVEIAARAPAMRAAAQRVLAEYGMGPQAN